MINIVHWKCIKNNWGDAIAEYLAEQLSGGKVKWYHGEDVSTNDIRYTVTGSINQWLKNNNTVIWGTGFISNISQLYINPLEICAVRGPKTREKMIKFGQECPEIYGDPVLLMPRFFNPKIEKKYKYGLIPHYVDYNNPWIQKYSNNKDVKIIRITNTPEEVKEHRFVKELLECEVILSSSLHGLICADAYGIPSYWIELSDKVVGNGFKFLDYFMSVNRPDTKAIRIKPYSLIRDFSSSFHTYKIDIDLEKLYDSCPFKK